MYCADNPVNYIDLKGDSLTISNTLALDAIYNGLGNSSVKMEFNNGVLDPNSIKNASINSSNSFLHDLYEISIAKQMVELNITTENSYIMNGHIKKENWTQPYDFNVLEEAEPLRGQLLEAGMIPGKTIQGNLGQTLYPISSDELKRSTNSHIMININQKASFNQQTCGIAHEFGHVILYLRNQPHSHSGNADFIYGRQWNVMKSLGYDFLESPTGKVFR